MNRNDNPRSVSYQDFCALAVSYMTQLYNAARRMTVDSQEAEDLVQDTYQRAFQAYHQLRGLGQCRAWLYQIMRNLFIDACRRKRTTPELVLIEGSREGEEDSCSTVSASAEEDALRHFSAEEIRKALAALPEEMRTQLVLCDIEGFTYQEIAEIVGCPLGTVRSRIARARHALFIKLRPQFDSSQLVTRAKDNDALHENV